MKYWEGNLYNIVFTFKRVSVDVTAFKSISIPIATRMSKELNVHQQNLAANYFGQGELGRHHISLSSYHTYLKTFRLSNSFDFLLT